jgi:hypothetical protein
LVGTDTYRYDITLTLQSTSFISALTGGQQGDATFVFTGMQVQPDGGGANYFVTYSSPITDLPEPPWVPGSGTSFGVMGGGGKVGVTVDQNGTDIIAGDATEYGYGIVLGASSPITISFSADIYIPHGPGSPNMQMGWTGTKLKPNGTTQYIRAQNSIDLVQTAVTPELPSLALLLSSLPLALGYVRMKRRGRTTA